jgi:mRNA-degrading endonuclease RelE of RelBE toxin-antitoxin system
VEGVAHDPGIHQSGATRSTAAREARSWVDSRCGKRFAADGAGDVKKLHDVTPPTWRLRFGRWRVLYRVDASVMVVVAVRDRRDAYR